MQNSFDAVTDVPCRSGVAVAHGSSFGNGIYASQRAEQQHAAVPEHGRLNLPWDMVQALLLLTSWVYPSFVTYGPKRGRQD